MEKIKSNYDHKDYMRMAMLKHEETFKEQVYELHRLYRMQKMLMQNVALNQQKQERFLVDSNKGFTIDYNRQDPGQGSNLTNVNSHQSNISVMGLHGPENDQVLRPGPIVRPYNPQEHIEESNNNVNTVLDESEIELTLSLGPSTHNRRRRKTESGHESLSSSSTGSSQTRKTSPKNNTTSLLARGDRRQFTWGSSTDFPQGSDLEPTFSNGPPNNSSPWLFQALSLKSST
ncbi:uncharacterized protein LOC141623127 [Silene latifolia]|uniref:uncharacterized protein LOC141623127 n=1 Tax=Silene latifolia TaxID=37657 RepID=UPI003D781956